METELKTLEDFDFHYPYQDSDELQERFDKEKKDELKTEAVKIIKVLKEEQRYKEGVEIPKEHLSFFDEEYYSFENVINFIMWQNNLNEEDLK